DLRNQEEALRKQFEQEFERLFGQGEAANANSTNRLNTISSPVNVVSSSFTTIDPKRERAQRNESENISTNPLMPDVEDTADLQDTRIFSGAYDDEVEGAVADFNNLELTTVVSPISTTRIHKDHPKEKIIGDPLLAPQTRIMTKTFQEHVMVSYIKKQRRTNHKDYHNCLFACFLSQIKPKKVNQALTDPSWIEAMQDELLQFRLQKVWRLVDLPKGKHVIGTKWVYRKKKDERGIVVRNKARLVAQGYGCDFYGSYSKISQVLWKGCVIYGDILLVSQIRVSTATLFLYCPNGTLCFQYNYFSTALLLISAACSILSAAGISD
nr:hypothetical protein [Tanacetum cinerariifolium]GFA22653.1 hypothetical protein [Tanacetum cinerariifolium]